MKRIYEGKENTELKNDILAAGLDAQYDQTVKELVEMCNLSQGIREDAQKEGRAMERKNAICKLIRNGFDKDTILSLGYTEEECKEAENAMASLV